MSTISIGGAEMDYVVEPDLNAVLIQVEQARAALRAWHVEGKPTHLLVSLTLYTEAAAIARMMEMFDLEIAIYGERLQAVGEFHRLASLAIESLSK